MRYSTDLGQRVLDFVNEGGSKAAASRIYGVSRTCIYNWLNAEDPLAYKNPGPKPPTDLTILNWNNMSLIFLTARTSNVPHTSVFPRGVFHTHLRNSTSCEKKTLTYKEQCREKRQVYLDRFAIEVQANGKTPVYVDESGFSSSEVRRYAYAPKGMIATDKISGWHRYQSTSLIAARIGANFTAPVLFPGACEALAFNACLEHQLCALLDERHVVIMDNASFHKGSETARLISETGASLLFLPPYAPELNPIEKDFANSKRSRQYNPEVSIEQIIKLYK